MKKYLLTICIAWLGLISFASADIIGSVNFQGSINSGSTYQSSLSGISLNTDVIYKFKVLTNGTSTNTGYISFGMAKINWWIGSSNTCDSISMKSFTDNASQFTFKKSTAGTCITEIYFKYTANQVGNKDFNYSVYYGSSTNTNTFTLRVNNNISIINAFTKDNDSDGFIDGYSLLFSSNFIDTAFDITKLSISYLGTNATNLTKGTSYTNGGNYYIDANFSDNIWNGGIRPEVSLIGFTNLGITFSSLLESAQIEIDQVKPLLKTINGVSTSSSAIQINSNDNLILDFSESMLASSVTGNISILDSNSNTIAGVWSKDSSNKQFTFNPNSNLNGNIQIIIPSSVKDLSNNGGNGITYSSLTLSVLDTDAPTGVSIGSNIGISINGGVSSTSSRYVNLSLKATDNYGVYQMMIANDSSFTSASWQSYNESITNWQLTSGNGSKTVYVKFKDSAGNVSTTYSTSITLNASVNYIYLASSIQNYIKTNSLSISGSCSYDNPSATLQLEYSINGGAYQDLTNCNNSAGNKTWSTTLSSFNLNTTNSITIRFKAYTSVSLSFDFIHDTAGPTGSINIAGGSTYSNNQVVSLTLNASDSNGINRIYLTGDLVSANAGYNSYSTSKSIQLTSGDGTKSIGVIYEDNAGNTSIQYTDTIILDTTNPTGSININGGNSYTNNINTTLSISASDTNGLSQMKISQDSNFVGANYESYSTSKSFSLANLEGTQTVYIKIKDNAGNESSTYSDTIIVDLTAPTTTISPIAGSFDNSDSQTVTLSCGDTGGSGCYRTYYKIDNGSYQQYTAPFTISGNNETKKVYYYSIDNAGNTESTSNISYVFDSSYINITTSIPTYASGNTLTVVGGCNNVGGDSSIEYKIGSSSWQGNISCNSNNWTHTITLNQNSTNSISYRLKNRTSRSTSFNIMHDNTAPTSVNFTIENGANIIKNQTINIVLTGYDLNGLNTIYITGDTDRSYLTGYVDSLNIKVSSGDGSKSIKIKLKDNAGNWSNYTTKSVTLDSGGPTVTVNPAGGNFVGSKTVILSLSESGKIYYSYNPNANLLTEGTLYSSPFVISSSMSLKVIGVDNAGNQSEIKTYIFNIQQDSSSDSNSSGGGGGGGGGGGAGGYYTRTNTTKTTTKTNTTNLTGENKNTTQETKTINNTTVEIKTPIDISKELKEQLPTIYNEFEKLLETKKLTGKLLEEVIKKYNKIINNESLKTMSLQDATQLIQKEINNLMNNYVNIVPSKTLVDQEFEYALGFLRNYGLTKFNSVDEYQPFENLTREQASKFFVQYTINVLKKTPNKNLNCSFTDIENSDPSLKEYIITSCQLGLFKGKNGEFKPFENITKAQAIAVLIRTVVGTLDESGPIWYQKYFDQAIKLGYIKAFDSVTNKAITPESINYDLSRYEAGLLLYRSYLK